MEPFRCCVCNGIKATRCSVCKSAAYCSPVCQKKDWRSHKLLCKAMVEFTTKSPRPTPLATLALHFPILKWGVRGTIPTFFWLEDQKGVEKTTTTGELLYTSYIEDANPADREVDIEPNDDQPFPLVHTVLLYCQGPPAMNGDRINLCLLETTQGDLKSALADPLIVYAKSKSREPKYEDLTLSDFRAFLIFCKCFGPDMRSHLRKDCLWELELTNPALFDCILRKNSGGRLIKGVEIACEADIYFLKVDKFLSVEVSQAHPIYDLDSYQPTKASKMIEIPLVLRRVIPDPRWNKIAFGKRVLKNSTAEYLDINTDAESDTWGFHDLGYDAGGVVFARILVVREDLKDITPHQVEAIAAFFRKDVFPKTILERRLRLSKLRKEELKGERENVMKDLVSRARFKNFFEEYSKAKIKGGDETWEAEKVP